MFTKLSSLGSGTETEEADLKKMITGLRGRSERGRLGCCKPSPIRAVQRLYRVMLGYGGWQTDEAQVYVR